MTIAQIVDSTGIILLALALVAAVLYYGLVRRSPPSTPLDLPLLAVLVSLLICHLFAVDQRYSAWRILVWCGYLAVFYLALAVPQRWIVRVAGILICLVMLICIVEVAITQERARGLGNPNITGAWLLSLVFLLPSSWFWSIVGMFGIITTGSRGAFLALFVADVGVAGVRFFPQPQRWILASLVLLLVLILCSSRPFTVFARLYTWEEAGRMFLERPLVGWGPGCYPVANGYEPGKDHADNFVLTVAAETGIVGLAAWGWLFVAVARVLACSEARARLGLVAWAIHNLVDCTLWWSWPGLVVMGCLACMFRNGGRNVN